MVICSPPSFLKKGGEVADYFGLELAKTKPVKFTAMV
jgi:hypothetical protein